MGWDQMCKHSHVMIADPTQVLLLMIWTQLLINHVWLYIRAAVRHAKNISTSDAWMDMKHGIDSL